jgi:hypothetical protein
MMMRADGQSCARADNTLSSYGRRKTGYTVTTQQVLNRLPNFKLCCSCECSEVPEHSHWVQQHWRHRGKLQPCQGGTTSAASGCRLHHRHTEGVVLAVSAAPCCCHCARASCSMLLTLEWLMCWRHNITAIARHPLTHLITLVHDAALLRGQLHTHNPVVKNTTTTCNIATHAQQPANHWHTLLFNSTEDPAADLQQLHNAHVCILQLLKHSGCRRCRPACCPKLLYTCAAAVLQLPLLPWAVSHRAALHHVMHHCR